jgi:hypothetical protein
MQNEDNVPENGVNLRHPWSLKYRAEGWLCDAHQLHVESVHQHKYFSSHPVKVDSAISLRDFPSFIEFISPLSRTLLQKIDPFKTFIV